MTDHVHCYCFPVCHSVSHTGAFEIDEKGRKRPIVREENTRDTMCCHCGKFKEGRLKFNLESEKHGILRHNISVVKGDAK